MDKNSLSERDICTKFITPAVKQAGWDEMLQIREEVSFTKGRIIVRGKLVTRGKAKRADYILYYKPNIPLALIEAKDNNHSVGDGMQQGARLRRRRSTSPSCSPPTATASCSTTAPARAPQRETNLALDAFPSPGRSVGALSRLEGPDARSRADRPSGLLRRRQRQGAALLPGQRRQRGDRGHRQGPRTASCSSWRPAPARPTPPSRSSGGCGRPGARNASCSWPTATC